LHLQKQLKEQLRQSGVAVTALGAHRCSSAATVQPCLALAPMAAMSLTRPSSLPDYLSAAAPVDMESGSASGSARSRSTSECSDSTLSAVGYPG